MSYDSSLQSLANPADLSLASLPSDFSTPPRPGSKLGSGGRPSLRVPSTSSGTTAPSSAQVSTPSPPASSVSAAAAFLRKNKNGSSGISSTLSRRYTNASTSEEDADADPEAEHDVEGAEKSLKWGEGISSLDTPVATRNNSSKDIKGGAKTKGTPGKGTGTLTLRDQEKVCISLVYSIFLC
ncbi:hypothetical protein VKT23_018761 [Stygiomarasmius scandens]|uniref:Uncharacterized protein n=1 Tax=Marasmiellus scandens TaxID=2682957 RepID=A0ABR1IRN9_9AGAR